MRALSDLIDRKEPAWPLVQQWVREASVPVEVLPATPAAGDAALLGVQVTTRSSMGAVTHNCAGILIDHGWLRVLGAGQHPRFQRALPDWNQGRSNQFYLVADDVVGGFFALNGGAFGDDLGKLYYFTPDSLGWQPCGLTYTEFLVWAMSDHLHLFYTDLRWEGWIPEVQSLTGDQALNIYPFLCADGPPIGERRRAAVPIAEQWAFQVHLQQQLEPSEG